MKVAIIYSSITGNTKLLAEAIKKDRIEILILLIEKKIDLNQNINGLSPLHYAIECNSPNSVEALVKTSQCKLMTIDGLNEIDRCFNLAKKIGEKKNSSKELAEINKKILSKIVFLYQNQLLQMIDDSEKFISFIPKSILKFPAAYFLLKQAIYHLNKEIVVFLIENGLSSNCMDENGFTLLHYSAMINFNFDVDQRGKLLEIIIFLIQKGADKAAIDVNGRLALHYASENGYPEIAAELALPSLCHIKDIQGKTPIDLAKNTETKEILELISQRISDDLSLPEESEEKMLKVIESTEEITTDIIYVAIGKDYEKLMKVILEKGVKPNTKDTDGFYLLHHAAMKNAIKCAKILLLYGASANCCDDNHRTPLHYSIQNGNVDLSKLLIDCDAKNQRDNDGFHPTDLLPKNSSKELLHLVKKFKKLCGVMKHLFMKEYEEDMLQVAKSFGFILLEKVTIDGDTEEIRELIQDYHISPNATNPFGVTSLHIACMYDSDPSVVEILIKLGCKVNSRTILGFTPLHFAAMKNRKNIAKILIKKGASVKITNVENKTAADIAAELGFNDFLKIIKTKNSKKSQESKK